jgi:hypothetical protein
MSERRHDDQIEPEELEEQAGDLLPDREALSLIGTDPTSYPLPIDDFDTTSAPGGAAAGSAANTAGNADDLASTDAQASGSGSESVTSEDRSEQISQSDSASSET